MGLFVNLVLKSECWRKMINAPPESGGGQRKEEARTMIEIIAPSDPQCFDTVGLAEGRASGP